MAPSFDRVGAGRTVGLPLAARSAALAAALLLAAGSAASAATRVVDRQNAQCTDGGSGAASAPFCTITAAARVTNPGDTVVVRAGTYPEEVRITRSGTSAAPVRFQADPGVTVSGASRGFDVAGASWIELTGFAVSGTSAQGIKLSLASNVTVSDATVSGTGDYGIYVLESTNIAIRDSEVTDTDDHALYVKFSDQVTVDGNRVAEAGEPVDGSVKKGIYVYGSSNVRVIDNLTENNSDAGIFVTNGSSGIRIEGNVTRNNARVYLNAAAGIDLRGSNGNLIIGNWAYDNEDSGINVRSAALNNSVINNVVYNNGDHGIDFLNAAGGRIIGNSVYFNLRSGLEVEGESSNMTLINNISVDNARGGQSNIRVTATSVPGTVADYNIVHLTGSGISYIWAGEDYATLAAARAANPGLETHGLDANPRWVAPGSGDFHLQAGSPAIDSANSGAPGALAVDIEQKGRFDDPATANTGAGPRAYDDRGAHEFQGGGTPPPNDPPVITAGPTATPNPVGSGQSSTVSVTANDSNGDPLEYSWSITSGGGSIIGSGSSVTYQAPAVTATSSATVRVEVSDGFGGLDSGSVTIGIEPDAPPPSNTDPEITSGPSASPANITSAQTSSLSVTAEDPDGDPLGYAWSVPPGGGSIDGSGPTVTYLPPTVSATQVYTIDVTVSDGNGGSATGSVEVTVDPAPATTTVSFRPTADASVEERSPTANHGSGSRLNVDASAAEVAYLRFSINGLTGAVRSALLRLEAVGGSNHGGTIHSISDNSWGEATITWANRPAVDGPARDSLPGTVSKNDVVDFDVTAAIQGNGTYNFAIVSPSSDGVAYRSREGSTNTPLLIVEME